MARALDRSGWIETAGTYTAYPTLSGDHKTDWLIIGGGYTGLAAAHRLTALRPGDRIMLIDGRRIAQGASGRNSGFVVGYGLPEELSYGIGRAVPRSSALWALDRAGGEEVKALIARHMIDCDYREGGYFYAAHEVAQFADASRYADMIRDIGGKTKVFDRDELANRFGTDFYQRGLWIGGAGTGFLHGARFSKGLADALPHQVERFEHTRALKIESRPGGGSKVTTEAGSIDARQVIVGLNAELPAFGYKRLRIFPVALTASLTRPLTPAEEEHIHGVEPWAVLSPVKGGATIRLTPDRRLLVRNTAEFRPEGISEELLVHRRKKHELALARRFPWLPADAIAFSWTGAICISRNGRFVFEELQPGVFAVACYNGTGVTRACLLGRLIAEHAAGEGSELIEMARSVENPPLIPPAALFRPLAALRFHFEHKKAHSER